jgi:outer membrane protein assembly factor BamB
MAFGTMSRKEPREAADPIPTGLPAGPVSAILPAMTFTPWTFATTGIAGWTNRPRHEVATYLREDRRIPRDRPGPRPVIAGDCRERCPAKTAVKPGRDILRGIPDLFSPRAFPRRRRRPIAREHDAKGRGPRQAVAVLLALACGSASHAGDWTGFLGGPERTARSDEKGLLQTWPANGPPLLWRTTGLGYGHGEVLVVGESVYTHGSTKAGGQLQCLDRLTGRIRWRVSTANEGSSTPAWMKDRLYVYARNLICHDAKTGELLWSADLRAVLKDGGVTVTKVPEPYYATGDVQSPLAFDGIVVVALGQPGAAAIALDAGTGKLRWISKGEKQAIGRGWSSVSVVRCGNRNVILVPCTGDLLGVDPADGKVLWEERCYPPERSSNGYIYTWACPPAYSDGLLFVHAGYKAVEWTTFRLTEGGAKLERAWNVRRIAPNQENVVTVNGLLFGSGRVWAGDLDRDRAILLGGKSVGELPPDAVARMLAKRPPVDAVLNVQAVSPGTTLVCQDLKTGVVRGASGIGKLGGHNQQLITYADGRLYVAVSGLPEAIYLVEPSPKLTVHGQLLLPFAEILKPENQPVQGRWGGFYARPQVSRGLMWVRVLDQLRVFDLSASGATADASEKARAAAREAAEAMSSN